jgi:hypothetical protein
MIRAFVRRGVTMSVTCATGVVAASTSASAVTASAATPGQGMSTLEVIGIFAGIPIGVFLLISLLVMAPDLIRRGSRQPGMSWSGPPEWFGARPAEAGTPLERTGDSPELESGQPRGGASPEGGVAGRGGAGGQW